MKPTKAIAGILSTGALVFGGVDASVLNEQPIERIETIAENRVEAKQVGNVVETTLPWKDQAGIKVKYDLGEPTVTEKFKDKRKQEVVTELVDYGDGSMKVDILLNEKPDTNVFCYAIEGAENYDFFFQPPLTEQEKAEGASRPPEIEGSYAVYHKTLKNHEIGKENYATGKVMHIPRPQVWSMSDVDTKVWADMTYDNGSLCVTVPQDFLNGAKYPVRVDPTFGYTTKGSTESASTPGTLDLLFCIEFNNSPESGAVYSISSYFKQNSTSNPRLMKAIFSSSSTAPGYPYSLIATSSQWTLTDTWDNWRDFPVPTTTLSVANHFLCHQADNGIASPATENAYFQYYDTATYNRVSSFDEIAAPTIPSIFPSGKVGANNLIFSTYATYVPILPIVTTNDATKIRATNVILSGQITNFANITSKGFVYGFTSDLSGIDTATVTSQIATTTSNFSYFLENLTASRTYYFKAFGTNATGTSFGVIKNFTTTAQKTNRINNGTIRINNGKLDI